MRSHRLLRRVVAVASATAVVLVVSLSAAASPPVDVPQNSVWHRLDMDHANAAPELERLSCSRGVTWTCHYDKVPEPTLNFWWDTTSGDFVGTDVKQTWTCPGWFPTSVCENVTMVVAGTMSITRADGISFSGPFDLVLARAGSDAQGRARLPLRWPCSTGAGARAPRAHRRRRRRCLRRRAQLQ